MLCREIRGVIRLVGRDPLSVRNGLGPAAELGRPDTQRTLKRSALRGVRMSTARRQIHAVIRLVVARLAGRPGSLGVSCGI